ncbi:MAG TPA: FAD-dependent oxidoreductase, partial [Gammaproteobacteria bacterium]|nr:FAD-dependent oxidoreductase [Gammaproteobacteria bacterium]
MATPPGVSERDFARALTELRNAVGADWVFTSDEDLNLYRDAYSPFKGEARDPVPSAAVAPTSVEQVQAIVRIANTHKIPLWTISTGRNLGYGGSAPAYSGSVIVDLKRMNRIIEVNDKAHYAVVEPGVSYFDLYRFIEERGLKVWIDPADPGWGSPLGNALERGGGRTPMRDHWNAVCGLEVVLANGEILRTGMGAMENSEVWHQYKYGFGPLVDGLFSQSNFGIVTRMGLWLMPSPEGYRDGRVNVAQHDDLVPFMETYAYLMNSDILRGTMLLESPLLNYHVTQGGSFFEMPNGPSTPELDRLARERNLPYWSAELRFWGPPRVIDAQWEYVKEKFGRIPGATFAEGHRYAFPAAVDQNDPTLTVALGIPSLGVFGLLRGGGHLGFSPIIPMTGDAVFRAQKAFGRLYAELALPAANQFAALPWSYNPRALVLLFGLPMSQDKEQNRQSREIFERLVEVSAEN